MPNPSVGRLFAAAVSCLVAWTLAAAGVGSGCRSSIRPPNVILISVDTLRADRLNAYGYAARTTSPSLDALAHEGVLFENAVTAAPWTTPAHMSLFTSLTPCAHGMVDPYEDLMSQRFRNAVSRLPEERLTLAEALAARGYATAAFTGGVTLDPRIGFDQGFSRYTTDMFKVSEPAFAGMLGWVREHRSKPFFLFWHSFEVHFPYLDASFLGDVSKEPEASGLRGDLERLGRVLAADGFSDRVIHKEERMLERRGALRLPVLDALYAGGVHSMDQWLGRLVRFLRQEGLYEDALIIVSSDHGEELADHDPSRFHNNHGHSQYQELVHVPLVLRLPRGARAGTRVTSVARTIDVFPTVLDVAGLPPVGGIEGTSLRSTWEGSETVGRVALAEAAAFGPERKAVRKGRFKYIITIDAASTAARGRNYVPQLYLSRELYDLERDPAESRNLLAGAEPGSMEGVAGELDRALRERVARRLGRTDRTSIDDTTVEKLKALGYVQ